jgi:hypothetical protein
LGTVHGLVGNTRYGYAVPTSDGGYIASTTNASGAVALGSSMNLPEMGQPAIINISGIIDQNANDMYPAGDAWAEQVRNVAVATSTTVDGSGATYTALPTIASAAKVDGTAGSATGITSVAGAYQYGSGRCDGRR